MKQHGRTLYWTLFASTFMLSAVTFGGGYVIVPLLKRKFVDELHWIDEQEMLDMVAIAQSSPGPLAVNASIIIASVVITMATGVLRQKRVLPVCIMLGTFAASALLNVNVVICILACAAIGIVDMLIQNHKAGKGEMRE